MNLQFWKLSAPIAALLIVFCAYSAYGAEGTAWVSLADGKVQVRLSGQGDWINIGPDYGLEAGDSIRTGRKSSSVIKWNDGNVTQLFENTVVHFKGLATGADGAEMTGLKMDAGRIVVHAKHLAGDSSHFVVRAPTGIVGVKGTDFFVEIEKDGSSRFGVLRGEIFVASKGSQVELSGESLVEIDARGNIGEPSLIPKRNKIKMYRALMEIVRV